MSKIFGKHRTMQRTDHLNIQCCCHFQKLLYLCAIFSYDSNEVSSCFIIPRFFHIQRTEFSKSICGKQDFFGTVIRNHNLWPMYHRCKYKGKLMIAKRQCSTIFHLDLFAFQIQFKEVVNHIHGFPGSYYGRIWINFQKIRNISCMVRFHVLYNQIIRFTSFQNLLNIVQPLVSKLCIYGIHNCNLLIQNHIGIVRHSIWHFILSFKQVDMVIIYSNIFNRICNFHYHFLHFLFMFSILYL